MAGRPSVRQNGERTLQVTSIIVNPKQANRVRGIILLVAVLTASLDVTNDGSMADGAALGLTGLLYVLLTALSESLRKGDSRCRTAITVGDIILVTIVIWVTGGVNSEYYVLYYLPLVIAGLRQEIRSGVVGCLLATFAYAATAIWAPREPQVLPFAPFRVLTVCLSAFVLMLFFSLLNRGAKLCDDLRDTLHHSLRRVAAVYDVAHAANTGADFSGVLSIILEHAARATGAATGTIFLMVEGELKRMASLTMPGGGEPASEPSLEDARRAVASHAPVHRNAVGQGPETADRVEVAYVPLLTASGPIGALSLVAGRDRGFARRHLDFLVSLCSEAAIAIENAQLRSELRRLAVTDYLTGLANRREFERRLSVELERAARYGRPLSVMIIDVDDLKEVNDAYGHALGDEVLRALAALVKQSIRSSEIAGRMGGDEFAVVLPETDVEGALPLADRIIQHLPGALREWAALADAGPIVEAIGVSAGIADTEGRPVSAKALVAYADAALYEAKRRGKNQAFADTAGGRLNSETAAGSSSMMPASAHRSLQPSERPPL